MGGHILTFNNAREVNKEIRELAGYAQSLYVLIDGHWLRVIRAERGRVRVITGPQDWHAFTEQTQFEARK